MEIFIRLSPVTKIATGQARQLQRANFAHPAQRQTAPENLPREKLQSSACCVPTRQDRHPRNNADTRTNPELRSDAYDPLNTTFGMAPPRASIVGDYQAQLA